MTSRDFVYWLQGFLELAEPETLDERQLDLLRRHLSLVFVHEIDPQAGGQAVQDVLNNLHENAPQDVPNAHSDGLGPKVFRC